MWFRRRTDPMSAYERGNECVSRGDATGAATWYQKAIDSGDMHAAVEAGIKLGIMSKRLGDFARAESAYRAAMATGHPGRAPVAAYLLTAVLQKQARHRDAIEAYEYIVASGHELAVNALIMLGEIHHYDLPEADRDLGRAADYFRRAIDTGDPDHAPKAMVSLADVYAKDQPQAAIEWYERAIDTGHVEAAPAARKSLLGLKARLGDEAPELPGPGLREAVGASGHWLLLDRYGKVYGIWFEDELAGSRCSADPSKVDRILMDNGVTTLVAETYFSFPDGDRGGYTIEFRPSN